MKRVWRTLVLGSVATAAGYGALLAFSEEPSMKSWALPAMGPFVAIDASADSPTAAHRIARAATSIGSASMGDLGASVDVSGPVRLAQANDDELPKPFSGRRLAAPPSPDAPVILPPAEVRPIQTPQIPAETRPKAEDGRRRLTASIQKELKRVGCFTGEVDGDWNRGTQRSMRDFNARINATLPVEQPDYILLTLLQGYAEKACSPGCPAGRQKADSNTCDALPTTARKTKPDPVPAAEKNIAASEPGQHIATRPAVRPQPSAEVVLEPPRKPDDQQRLAFDPEQTRLNAAIEQRKRELADREAAQRDAERRERLAAIERDRAEEDARRLAALAAAATQRPTSAIDRIVTRSAPIAEPAATVGGRQASAAPGAPFDLNGAPRQEPRSLGGDSLSARRFAEAADRATPKKLKRATRRLAAQPRVSQPYLVGRLPPRNAYWGPTSPQRASAPRPQARRGSTQAIFPFLSRFSP